VKNGSSDYVVGLSYDYLSLLLLHRPEHHGVGLFCDRWQKNGGPEELVCIAFICMAERKKINSPLTAVYDSKGGQTKISPTKISLIYYFFEGGKTVFDHGIISVVWILHRQHRVISGHLLICSSKDPFEANIQRCPLSSIKQPS